MSCLEKKTENKKNQSFEDQRKKVHKTLSPEQKKQNRKTKTKTKQTNKKNMAVSTSHELRLLRCVY